MLRLLAILFALSAAAACQDMHPSPTNPDGAPAQDAATGQPDASGGLDAAPATDGSPMPPDGGLNDGGMDDGGVLGDGGLDDATVAN